MGSLKDTYPIIMNGTTIPFFPTSWQRSPQKIQSVNQSEGGKDIVNTTRIDKMSISATFAIADKAWVQFFNGLNDLDVIVVQDYSPSLDGYDRRDMRMVDFTCSARRKSEELASVLGVWDVTFTLEEF